MKATRALWVCLALVSALALAEAVGSRLQDLERKKLEEASLQAPDAAGVGAALGGAGAAAAAAAEEEPACAGGATQEG
eukprot:CAMPEP_0174924534 /NCGR_PEP_ID=MMETSP1355-20121228/7308_1 /TAXON_ID=464990 /ORGANISM="Hemiselmis tepida, Strain CCMP443" /LENGTH=77 /DNA_ID=CAMNT_0016170351 /DNA_START=122 /DNA_END=352 /DNA_ORIENTATION=+